MTPTALSPRSFAGALAALGFNFERRATRICDVPPDTEIWPLAEAAGLGCAQIDEQCRVVRHNAALARLLRRADLRGLALQSLMVGESALVWRELWEKMVADKAESLCASQQCFRCDGVAFQGRLTVQRSSRGAFAGLLLEDVSDLHEARESAVAARSAIHDLSAIATAETDDWQTKVHSLLEMGCNRFGLETGVLVEFEQGDAPLSTIRAKAAQTVSPDERIRRGRAWDVDMATGTAPGAPPGLAALTLAALAGETKVRQFFNGRGATLGAGVTVGGDVFGALNFSGYTPRTAPFEQSDLELLQLMARWVGSEIERAETRSALEARQKELESKQLELLAANAQLEELATTDGLTGIKNRRSFDLKLAEEFQRAQRYGVPLSLLLLDVDKFKGYNDSFGHPAGDEVLKNVANILADGVRGTDFVARYGGEEFAIVLTNTDTQGAMILAERLREAIEIAPWTHRAVTASFGACTFRGDMKVGSELTAGADAGLYAAKEAGRNRVVQVENCTAENS